MHRTIQETIRITYCGWGLPKQQRRAANEPSTNANMFGDHAEPDFTAKDVVQLTLINAWALRGATGQGMGFAGCESRAKHTDGPGVPSRWQQTPRAVGRKTLHLARGGGSGRPKGCPPGPGGEAVGRKAVHRAPPSRPRTVGFEHCSEASASSHLSGNIS